MNDRGFTAVELMITIAFAGILAAIAIPSWIGFVENQKLSSAVNELRISLDTLRSEAQKKKLTRTLEVPKFDSQITVVKPSVPFKFDFMGTTENTLPYTIRLRLGAKERCVSVRSLLGTISVGKNKAECDSFG